MTTLVTGRSTYKEAAPPRGAASTSRTGTCAGNGAVPKRRVQVSLVEHSRSFLLHSEGLPLQQVLVCLKAGGRELPGKGHHPAQWTVMRKVSVF